MCESSRCLTSQCKAMLDFQIITYCYGCEVILHCDSWLSLLTNGDKQVVTCLLAIRISYFVKCLLKSFTQFWLECLSSYHWIVRVLYMFSKKAFLGKLFAKTFKSKNLKFDRVQLIFSFQFVLLCSTWEIFTKIKANEIVSFCSRDFIFLALRLCLHSILH